MRAVVALALAAAAAAVAAGAVRSRSSAPERALLAAASRGEISRAIWRGGYRVVFGQGIPPGMRLSRSPDEADLAIPTAWGEVYLGRARG